MTMILAVEAFGRTLPDPRFLFVLVFFFAGFLLINRNSTGKAGRAGAAKSEGREYQCERCGHEFYPKKTVENAYGEKSIEYNDRCPNCGWDLDWGKPDSFGNKQ